MCWEKVIFSFWNHSQERPGLKPNLRHMAVVITLQGMTQTREGVWRNVDADSCGIRQKRRKHWGKKWRRFKETTANSSNPALHFPTQITQIHKLKSVIYFAFLDLKCLRIHVAASNGKANASKCDNSKEFSQLQCSTFHVRVAKQEFWVDFCPQWVINCTVSAGMSNTQYPWVL